MLPLVLPPAQAGPELACLLLQGALLVLCAGINTCSVPKFAGRILAFAAVLPGSAHHQLACKLKHGNRACKVPAMSWPSALL